MAKKKWAKVVLLALVILGILHRFYFQFIEPAFNIDEISLGENIKKFSFIELLYPFENFQSAPPLYLWLQKALILVLPFKFWINIKVLSFIVSSLSIWFFYRIVKANPLLISILLLIICCFNPYITYNSLTLKQYGIDLLGILILLNYYKSQSFQQFGWGYFLFWCLLSNVGLFACAGYLLFSFFGLHDNITIKGVILFIRQKFFYFLAPLPYIVFFIWYMQQDHAMAQKDYMTTYWQDTFIPLDLSIFKYTLHLLHEFWICFYSAVEFWGITLFVLSALVIVFAIKKRALIYADQFRLILCILTVHLFLNLIRMYPLSDRLFLYFAPLFIFSLGASLDILSDRLKTKMAAFGLIALIVITSFTYATYIGYKNNDVVSLNKFIDLHNDSGDRIAGTGRTLDYLKRFNEFTDNEFKANGTIALFQQDLKSYDYLVTKVHKKIKPGKRSMENEQILEQQRQQKISLIKQINGYNIYKISR